VQAQERAGTSGARLDLGHIERRLLFDLGRLLARQRILLLDVLVCLDLSPVSAMLSSLRMCT
jgi:hypothetical protein